MERAGISYFVKGNKTHLNPDLGVKEQADLLPYDQRYDFSKNKLCLGMRLGFGAFGEVLQATATGLVNGEETTTVAVKRLQDASKDEDIKAFISELKIMIYLGKHQHLVNLLGVVRENIKNRKILHELMFELSLICIRH